MSLDLQIRPSFRTPNVFLQLPIWILYQKYHCQLHKSSMTNWSTNSPPKLIPCQVFPISVNDIIIHPLGQVENLEENLEVHSIPLILHA